jgi:hypothetical protein
MGVLSLLHEDEIAVLPYIGISLTDLIFTEDGNPSFFVDSKSSEKGDPALPLVNFGKMRLISEIISQIKVQQRSPFRIFNRKHKNRCL